MSDLVQHISDDQFDSVVMKSEIPVLVDFWAEWCGPCKMIGPVLEQIAQDYKGRVSVVKVNVDEHQQHAAQFGVRSIPTLLVFKDGALLKTHVGALNKPQMAQLLDNALA